MAPVSMISVLNIILILSVTLANGGLINRNSSCPCEDVQLCNTPIHNGKEIIGFMVNDDANVWKKFDWNKLTTIALVGFDKANFELLCYAHKHNVKVVDIVTFPKENLLDKQYRSEWIENQVKNIEDNHMDGVNIDFEDEIGTDEVDLRNALTTLVAEISWAFHAANSNYQVSFDVAWASKNVNGDGVDGRNYDYKGLSDAVDFLFVMGYDVASQVFLGSEYQDDVCLAKANSGVFETGTGLMSYFQLGIDPNQLVFGQPWYGYDYECVDLVEQFRCVIQLKDYRGVNCSDIAGTQLSYSQIQERINSTQAEVMYDPHTRTPFSQYVNAKTNRTHQIWYDVPDDYHLKYNYANVWGLRGVGIWMLNFLDYSDSVTGQEQVKDMWNVIPSLNMQD